MLPEALARTPGPPPTNEARAHRACPHSRFRSLTAPHVVTPGLGDLEQWSPKSSAPPSSSRGSPWEPVREAASRPRPGPPGSEPLGRIQCSHAVRVTLRISALKATSSTARPAGGPASLDRYTGREAMPYKPTVATQQLLNGVMGTQAAENNTCYVIKFHDLNPLRQFGIKEKLGKLRLN